MALGNATFSDAAGAVSDLFSADLNAQGLRIKAQGDFAEATNYDLAAGLARENERFTEVSTGIKQVQAERQIYQTIGQQESEVGGGGFAASGSALDVLRSSAQQGALTHAVIGQQGLITEAGYDEQAQSYTNMAAAARQAGTAEDDLASQTSLFGNINAGMKGAAAIATLFFK